MEQYKHTSATIACPVCGGMNARVLWEISCLQAAQHFVLREKDAERFQALASHIEHLWGQATCAVVECEACRFCFSHPFRAGDNRFYELAYERHARAYPDWKWEFQITYEELGKISGPGFRLLDIGAGNGAFVKRVARDLLQRENILCTEFSAFGRREIEKMGISCLSQDLRELTARNFMERFDAVCLFQVLEHLDEPDRIFRHVNGLMKPGGRLFIAVPNPNSIRFNELNGALLDMPPNHIGRWNRTAFEELGRRTGFRVQAFRVENSAIVRLASQFVIYRYLRRSQCANTMENRMQRIRNRFLLRSAQVLGIAVNSLPALPALFKIDSRQGASQWVDLIKV